MKSQGDVSVATLRPRRKAEGINRGVSVVMKGYFLKEEERLYLLEDIQERSILELREMQEEEMTQQEVALYYSFLNQIEQEIQRQKALVIKVRRELELGGAGSPPLPFSRKSYHHRI